MLPEQLCLLWRTPLWRATSRQKAILPLQAGCLLGQPPQVGVGDRVKGLVRTGKESRKNHSELVIKVMWLIWVEPLVG